MSDKILSFLTLSACSLGLASLWMAYLIKIVLNDEELQERLRRIRRQREEQRRELEDKLRRKKTEDAEVSALAKSVAKTPESSETPPA